MKHFRAADVQATEVTGTSFTGGVWREHLVSAQEPNGLRLLRFTYAPGAHSHWHAHESGQAILVEQGHALVQRRGAPGILLGPGDSLYVAPGEAHWHGAVRDQTMVHLAFNVSGETTWLEPVTADEYDRAS